MKASVFFVSFLLFPFGLNPRSSYSEDSFALKTHFVNKFAGVKQIKPAPELAAFLSGKGFIIQPDFSVFSVPDNVNINWNLIQKAGFRYDSQGRWVDASGGIIENEKIVQILKGLLQFARVQGLSPKDVGGILQQWGVPPVFNGNHLLNPDGSATYFGLMFYQGVKNKPAAARQLSTERLSKSLALFETAHLQTFGKSAPENAYANLARAWDMLSWDKRQPGETPLPLSRVKTQDIISGQKKNLEAALSKERGPTRNGAEFLQGIAALNAAEKFRYHRNLDLPPVPSVPAVPATKEPSQRFLPVILRAMDKIAGKPLSSEQQEALIKSFPMGETVWRMGVQDLWRDGVTGQGVKVAVIDSGVGSHEDLGDAVKARADFLQPQGHGWHATHIAGVIHALAPDAELRSYRALFETAGENSMDNVIKAVDQAVKDGNQIISMSLSGLGNPDDSVVKQLDQYAREKGVIFVVAAGNSGGRGLQLPSNMERAITVGSLDPTNNRVLNSSSYGDSWSWDAERLAYVVKKVFVAPGKDIVSTLPSSESRENPYGKMTGTSMATPHVSGVMALLLQKARDLNRVMNPARLGQIAQDALAASARPIPRDRLPSDAPPDQEFVIVDPAAAYKALRSRMLSGVNPQN